MTSREAVVVATAGPPANDALDIGFTLDMSDEPRAKKRPARTIAQSAQPTPQPEEEVDEFEDEEVTLEIGSAATRLEDEFDDEFDGGAPAVGFGVVAQPSSPPPRAADTAEEAAADGEADSAVPPTNSPAEHVQAPAEPTGADAAAAAAAAAEKASQLAAAAAEHDRIALAAAAAAAEQQAQAAKQAGAAESISGLREEMRQALRSVQQVASASEADGAESVGQQSAVAHAPKSEAEKADETYAASLRKLTPHDAIAEGDEEEEDEAEAAAAAATGEAVAADESTVAAGASASDAPASSAAKAAEAAEAEAAKAARLEAMRAAREAAIMSQFDAATEAADQSRTLSKAEQRKAGRTRIFYAEATVALLGKEADLTEPMAGIVREDWASAPIHQRLLRPCRPRLRTPELRTQRDRLMALARVPMDGSELHERILMALYCVLTGDATWPPRYGSHWEVIGFQGNDPATDLRGAGMLALLQALHFQSKQSKLMQAIYQLSQKGGADFPFMTVSITMTQLALQALRAGALTRHSNQRRQVDDVMHEFHHACYYHMYVAWRQRSLTIRDFGFLKKEMEGLVVRKPGMLLAAYRAYTAPPTAKQFNGGGPGAGGAGAGGGGGLGGGGGGSGDGSRYGAAFKREGGRWRTMLGLIRLPRGAGGAGGGTSSRRNKGGSDFVDFE